MSVHEPSPSNASSEYLRTVNIPVFSQLFKHPSRYSFREDYKPYEIHNSDSLQTGRLLLYVLAGSKLDLVRTKIALSLSAVSTLPYKDHGTVSLLVYEPPNGLEKPFLSLIAGECDIKRVKIAVKNAIGSKRIPHLKYKTPQQLLTPVAPIVEVYNVEETLESIRIHDQMRKRMKNLSQTPNPQLETVDPRSLPFIDEETEETEEEEEGVGSSVSDQAGSSNLSSARQDASIDSRPGPSAIHRPVQRLVSDDFKDSGITSMPSDFTNSLDNIDEILEEENDNGNEAANVNAAEIVDENLNEKTGILVFDVIHMPPSVSDVGDFFTKFRANYYILPTGKGNGFGSKEAVQLNQNIQSNCRVIPTDQTVDGSWHNGKVKVAKHIEETVTAEHITIRRELERLYKIFEPIRVEDENAVFELYADRYGRQLQQRTKKFQDLIPPPTVYKQQTVVIGGFAKNGASFPMWPEPLTIPLKVQKVFHVKCVCQYCRYDFDEYRRLHPRPDTNNNNCCNCCCF